jgi:hypothetical protein
MTDIADLQRKAQAAREFQVVVGACTFTLRLPTAHQKEVEAMRARGDGHTADPALAVLLVRRLVEQAVVAWSGVTAEQLAPGGGSDAAELVPGAVALLLDNQPDTARVLTDAMVQRENERNNHVDAARKN